MNNYLPEPATTAAIDALYESDREELGYVMNASRLWARHVEAHDALFELLGATTKFGRFTYRQRGILVSATASTFGDSYCSFAWGSRLAADAGADTAAGVLRGLDDALTPAERALATWARAVVRDPNATTREDVTALRDAGYDDDQIFAVTLYVALRVAFSTVNDALGSQPDAELAADAPVAVREAITYGRRPEAVDETAEDASGKE